MSETSNLALRALQILISVPVLAAFVVGGLPVVLPMLLCRFAAGPATAT